MGASRGPGGAALNRVRRAAFLSVAGLVAAQGRAWAAARAYEIDGFLSVAVPGGDLRSKAGVVVSAFPDGPAVRAWLAASAREIAGRARGPGEFDDPAPPPELAALRRTAVTDAFGAFAVTGVAPGTWLLRGRLRIAFPRTVGVVREVPVRVAGGATEQEADVRYEALTDVSYVWLDSAPVRVGPAPFARAAFRVVARRDALAKVR